MEKVVHFMNHLHVFVSQEGEGFKRNDYNVVFGSKTITRIYG